MRRIEGSEPPGLSRRESDYGGGLQQVGDPPLADERVDVGVDLGVGLATDLLAQRLRRRAHERQGRGDGNRLRPELSALDHRFRADRSRDPGQGPRSRRHLLLSAGFRCSYFS